MFSTGKKLLFEYMKYSKLIVYLNKLMEFWNRFATFFAVRLQQCILGRE